MAFTCEPPGAHVISHTEQPFSRAEKLRLHSTDLARHLAWQMHDGDGKIVVGRFFRNTTKQFLHEKHYESIQYAYWPPSDETQMPARIEYSYQGVFRFEGSQISDGKLVPFSAKEIDAHITISSDYSGVVDQIPAIDREVIGVLKSSRNGRAFQVTTSICPTYFMVEGEQVKDLLACFDQGECKLAIAD